MKNYIEERQKNTLNYIKDYHLNNLMYPTYREILKRCGYSSLSLLSKDIDALVAKGYLIKNNRRKIQLKDKTMNKNEYYDFPLLFVSKATLIKDFLCAEDKELLKSQELYLQGNYQEAIQICDNLMKITTNINVKFGCLLTKCCCSLYTGNPRPWKETFLIILGFEPKTNREIMAKELCLYFLSTILGENQNCPKWLKEGRFYGLTEKALPFAKVAYVATIIRGESKGVSPYLLEPLCSEASIEGIDICQVFMDLYLAGAYHYYQNDEYVNEHLGSAIKTCMKNNWLTPLVEMESLLGTTVENALAYYDEEYVKKLKSLKKILKEGFAKVYSAIVGENPTKRLTLREGEIANYVRLGLTNKEIANKLNLSVDTIKYYLSSIYSKINVSGRRQLKQLMEKQD